MQGFISGDFRLVLERKADVIEPMEQAMTNECIHGKLSQKALVVAHFIPLQVDRNCVVLDLAGIAHQCRDFLFI